MDKQKPVFELKIRKDVDLRLVSEDRAEELREVVIENYEYLRPWLPWVNRNYSVQTARNFIRFGLQGFQKQNSLQGWLIENEKIIGGLGFNNVDSLNHSVEIGYWLAESVSGKGLMTEACRVFILHAFENLGIHRVVIRCALENEKSQAIPKRLGFTTEGVQREAEWLHDRFVDLIVFSMLKSDPAAGDLVRVGREE